MNGTPRRMILSLLLCTLIWGCDDDGSTAVRATSTPTSSPTASPSPSPTATTLSAAAACHALAGTSIGDAHIGSTSLVAAVAPAPQYCKLSARIDPALNFEMRLPSNWNQKALFLGGGGYDGLIGSPDDGGRSPGILAKGFASIATDSGHHASQLDGSWALNDPEAVDNFAYLSTHRVLLAAREILTARYGVAPRRAYFEGGSNGGREALIAAQRWPDDFDGITAREPAFNFTALQLAYARIIKQVFVTPGGYLDAAAVQTLGAAVMTACDGLDNITDGIVSNLAACHFDPATLLCAAPAETACLTAEQINTVNIVHSAAQFGFALADGITSHAGWPLGAEDSPAGWPLWITGDSVQTPSSFGYVLYAQFIKYFVTQDANFDPLLFAPDQYRNTLQSLSALIDATNADLSAFTAHGGKLILWHGLSDYGVSAYSTIDYYERVVAGAGGQSNADQFMRLYLSPGVDHTGGGAGAPENDFLTPLDAWVEAGTAPGDLVGDRPDPNTNLPLPFRPLCRYPSYPRYNGAGDPNVPSSFSCVQP